ncbi:patatin-like phospholipase family protein [Lentisalinibacter sediminis]|uniref:patatin-like phospholipase family protein n=1 Tax=Lentisalinibacter sediminis TaxID=2992237 RepID=UPI00386582DC
MAGRALRFLAGPGALAEIRERGLDPERIRLLAGASGGAKWLVLYGLDRIIMRELLPRLRGPVHLIGSSIGTWRFACYAQSDPLAALDRLRDGYVYQHYSERPDRAEITAKSREILGHTLGPGGPREILAHPVLRTHVMTARAHGPAASERGAMLTAGLVLAAAGNLLSRRSLRAFFSRALFSDPRDEAPFLHADDFPLRVHGLTAENLAPAILASGAIPLVIEGMRDIPGGAPGVYRDGGIIDYHLDLPLSAVDGITFYPHFYPHLIPGWFDKRLSWRRPVPAHLDRVLLMAPSDDFVAGLPGGRIPDRHDFRRYDPATRERRWKQAVAESERLGDEFAEVMQKGLSAERIEPLLP